VLKFSYTIHTTLGGVEVLIHNTHNNTTKLRGVAPLPFRRGRFVRWAAVAVCDKQRLSHYVNTKAQVGRLLQHAHTQHTLQRTLQH